MPDPQGPETGLRAASMAGLSCPQCEAPLRVHALDRDGGPPLEVDLCAQCGGVWFDRQELRHTLRRFLHGCPWLLPRADREAADRPRMPPALRRPRFCPRCALQLTTCEFAHATNVYVSRCPRCRGEWTDAGDALAIAEYSWQQAEAQQRRLWRWLLGNGPSRQSPAQYRAWHYMGGLVAALTGRVFPYVDENPRSRVPHVVVALIAINVVVFLWQTVIVRNPQLVIQTFGAIPMHHGHWDALWRIVTAMFVHAGFLHLLGNMYFLWEFGDNVEETLGSLRFLLFYLVCGIAADVAHVLAYPASTAPMVGASGAISGVMGAYCVFFPRARLKAILGRFYCFQLPAISYLAGWVLYQALMGALLHTAGKASGVAWFAHLGGFAVGAGLAACMRWPHELQPTASGSQEPSTTPAPPVHELLEEPS